MAHAGGRPAKYKTAEEMQKAIDRYFDACDNNIRIIYDKEGGEDKAISDPLPYTMTGLAIALGFESRSSLVDYKGVSDKFSYTIKKARLRVEESIEQRMLKSNGVVAGVIFNAKNNFGWKDKSEIDQNVNDNRTEPITVRIINEPRDTNTK